MRGKILGSQSGELLQVLGPDHRDTLLLRSNLADAYHAVGNTAKAITLHQQTLAASERVLGPDHRAAGPH